MEQIEIGQRVRVIDGSFVHYGQVGTVVDAGSANDWYVHLDHDQDRPAAQMLFHVAELEAVLTEQQKVPDLCS